MNICQHFRSKNSSAFTNKYTVLEERETLGRYEVLWLSDRLFVRSYLLGRLSLASLWNRMGKRWIMSYCFSICTHKEKWQVREMGTLLGHLVPGTFFIFFSIWWGFYLAIRHYRINHSRKRSIYRSSTTFPCLCCSPSRQIAFESYLKLCCSIFGMIGEFLTGFTHLYNENLKRKTWAFGENNAQHITMFFAFGLASLLEILVHLKYALPDGIEFVANILAYTIEGFLFHFHLHGRNEIDIHVHTLLVYAIVFCILAAVWEFNYPEQILATYARIAGTCLQGVW